LLARYQYGGFEMFALDAGTDILVHFD